MALQSCSVRFIDPINFALSCLSKMYTIMSAACLKVLRKNTSFQITPTTCLAPERLDDPVCAMNRIVLEGLLLRLIKPPGNILSNLSLDSTWHITNVHNDIFTTKLEFDISIPDTLVVFAILIPPATLAPPAGFHARFGKEIGRVLIPSSQCHENSSSPAKAKPSHLFQILASCGLD